MLGKVCCTYKLVTIAALAWQTRLQQVTQVLHEDGATAHLYRVVTQFRTLRCDLREIDSGLQITVSNQSVGSRRRPDRIPLLQTKRLCLTRCLCWTPRLPWIRSGHESKRNLAAVRVVGLRIATAKL